MTTNHVRDISKLYFEQVVESAVPGKPAEKLGAVTAIPKDEQDAARERTLAKAKAMREKKGIKEAKKAKPDYLDFDVDGNEQESMKKALRDKTKKPVAEAKKSNDGNLANNYPPYDKVTRGDVIAGALGKDQMGGKKKPKVKVDEKFSNWREDLIEIKDIIDKDKNDVKLKEMSPNETNKVVINPSITEAIEDLGGELLEMVEVQEIDCILDDLSESEVFLLSDNLIESVVEEFFQECIEEGYDIEEVENAVLESIEYSLAILNEEILISEETFLLETQTSRLSKVKGAVKRVAKGLAKGVGYAVGASIRGAKALGSAAKSGYERGRQGASAEKAPERKEPEKETKSDSKPGLLRRIGSALKSGLKRAVARGARRVEKAAGNVARRAEKTKTEKPSAVHSKTGVRSAKTYRGAGSGSVEKAGTPKPKKAEKPEDPWAGSATTPAKPKAKTKKAAPKAKAPAAAKPKRKRTSKLDDLLASVRSEETQINEMPYQVMGSPDGKKEKKIGKPVKSRKYADARAAELEDTHKKTGGKYRSQYVENTEYLDEKTLSDAETKKKEDIVKSMKDKAKDFEKRYPGRGKEVMYATATKLAKKLA